MEPLSAIEAILERIIREQATIEDISQLMKWLKNDPSYERAKWLEDRFQCNSQISNDVEGKSHNRQFWDEMIEGILTMDKPLANAGTSKGCSEMKSRFIWRRWWWAAASVAVLASLTIFWSQYSRHWTTGADIGTTQLVQQDILPGGNKAMLTLGNGQTITLTDVRNGEIVHEGETKLVKKDSGSLTYITSGRIVGQMQHVPYNRLNTPKGGQYEVTLSDGSKVWLNAASSIRYPVVFTGNQRMVELTGEGYFEVADDPKHPFVVKRGSTEVKVLGTHFNVEAYEDEPTLKVTLLEGAVTVSEAQSQREKLLRPGQQIEIDTLGQFRLVRHADLDNAIAWKNGYFNFQHADIHAVMRQLSRWYNADVVIKGNISRHFTGSIPRDIMLSGVFEVLQRTGSIHYEIDSDRKIIVSP